MHSKHRRIVIDLETLKKYLVFGDRFDTHLGSLDVSKPGIKYLDSRHYLVLEPEFVDLWETKLRGPQAMLLKDIGFILAATGVSDGWRVVELGCGGGSLTMHLANAVRPSGRVYAYDKETRWLEIARKNLERAGLLEYVELKQRDVYSQDIDERDLDLVVMDLPEPWKAIPRVADRVKPGKFLVAFVIHMEKIAKTHEALRDSGFEAVETHELLDRRIVVGPNGTRPEISGILHTGYIILARKVPE
jgi:tRNA (adenine57-N1/adenine58-N1)-methyltransferase